MYCVAVMRAVIIPKNDTPRAIAVSIIAVKEGVNCSFAPKPKSSFNIAVIIDYLYEEMLYRIVYGQENFWVEICVGTLCVY